MTLFVVLFEDNTEGAGKIRRQHLPAHLDFLDRHAAAVSTAGPLSERDGTVIGGLWLVEAESAEDVDRLVHEDPFWPTGLRRSVRVFAWTQVFVDGARRPI